MAAKKTTTAKTVSARTSARKQPELEQVPAPNPRVRRVAKIVGAPDVDYTPPEA